MKSFAGIILFIATVCGVLAHPTTVSSSSSSTTHKKAVEQKTEDWNKGLTSYPSFFADLNVPAHQRELIQHPKSTFSDKINLLDKDAPLGIPLPSKTTANTATSTIPKENRAKKVQIAAEASTPGNTTKSGLGFHHLVDIQENGCPEGYDKDPKGDCQKIEN